MLVIVCHIFAKIFANHHIMCCRKLLYRILVTILLLLLVGCYNHNSALLERAESIVTSYPDSALNIMDLIDVETLKKSDRAKYALLYTIAQDKSYIDVNSDSLIKIAVDFYLRYTSNFIRVDRFLLPWNILIYDNSCFNMSDLQSKKIRTLSKACLIRSPRYCIFSYTPNDGTVSSLWVNDVVAYIVGKFVTHGYEKISTIIYDFCRTCQVKNGQEKDRHRNIRQIFIRILKEISRYEIVEFKEFV